MSITTFFDYQRQSDCDPGTGHLAR